MLKECKVPLEDVDKIEDTVKGYLLKSALKGDRHDNKDRKAAP